MSKVEQFSLLQHIQRKIDKVTAVGREKGMTDEQIGCTVNIGLHAIARSMFLGKNSQK